MLLNDSNDHYSSRFGSEPSQRPDSTMLSRFACFSPKLRLHSARRWGSMDHIKYRETKHPRYSHSIVAGGFPEMS